MSDMCTCRHTSAWHQAGHPYTKARECLVDGCPCRGFERGGA